MASQQKNEQKKNISFDEQTSVKQIFQELGLDE